VKLDFSYSPRLPFQFIGDESRLRQVLVNLLNNAIKFTEEGTIRTSIKLLRDIQIQKGQTEYELLFEIQDTGIGISKLEQTKLFKSFSQVDSSLTRKYPGTGLGLVICKEICALMSGRIWCTSDIGKGSTFSFTVILQGEQISQKKIKSPSNSEEPTAKTNKMLANSEISRKLRFLLAEDNPINQKVACRILDRIGYSEIVTVTNGREAIEAYKKAVQENNYFDIIIMDIQMPELDGISTTKKIRQIETEHRPFIVALTANIQQTLQQECLTAGMDIFLGKPFQVQELRDVLHIFSESMKTPKH